MTAGAGTVAIIMWALLRPPHSGSGESLGLAVTALCVAIAGIAGICGSLASWIKRSDDRRHLVVMAELKRIDDESAARHQAVMARLDRLGAEHESLHGALAELETERVRREHRMSEAAGMFLQEEVTRARNLLHEAAKHILREMAANRAHFDKRVLQAITEVRQARTTPTPQGKRPRRPRGHRRGNAPQDPPTAAVPTAAVPPVDVELIDYLTKMDEQRRGKGIDGQQ